LMLAAEQLPGPAPVHLVRSARLVRALLVSAGVRVIQTTARSIKIALANTQRVCATRPMGNACSAFQAKRIVGSASTAVRTRNVTSAATRMPVVRLALATRRSTAVPVVLRIPIARKEVSVTRPLRPVSQVVLKLWLVRLGLPAARARVSTST